ncbi:MAG TPA: Rap1a/Tai family immunity protein [Allosphingosinicella sp.]|jgi:hypothetical protein|uniref:Rap1a/Tai family immunity protein n=1 Tax=Allosphingosinicella sp. TaxID=2823234 RepID=UPI002F2A49EE
MRWFLLGAIAFATPALAQQQTECSTDALGVTRCQTTGQPGSGGMNVDWSLFKPADGGARVREGFEAGQRQRALIEQQQLAREQRELVAEQRAALQQQTTRSSQPRAAEGGMIRNGNDILERCTQGGEAGLECASFVSGVVQGAQESLQARGAKQYFCMPDGVTLGQSIDIVTKYLTANPESRHMSAASLIVVGLAKSLPCPA